MRVFSSMGDALAWIDPHRERTWEEPSDADDERLLISRRYKVVAFRSLEVSGINGTENRAYALRFREASARAPIPLG
jgi:hypothetical protein